MTAEFRVDDDSQDYTEDRLRENRHTLGNEINSDTEWTDLVGKMFSVRQEQSSN